MTVSTERAVLAGGCFWGVQDLLRRYPGVISTRVGYTGGEVPNATYRNHGNHAEAIEITFDPQVISYRKLLEFFFQIHDPSTLNRQGNDRGASYRSAIFYTSDEQKRIAEDTIADVDASGLWPGKVVTEVAAAGPFWEAEPEHQDYLEKYPEGYTCHFIRPELDAAAPGGESCNRRKRRFGRMTKASDLLVAALKNRRRIHLRPFPARKISSAGIATAREAQAGVDAARTDCRRFAQPERQVVAGSNAALRDRTLSSTALRAVSHGTANVPVIRSMASLPSN